MATQPHNLLCDLLGQLQVPHTHAYSTRRFQSMPFPSLFGLSKLLQEYGVASRGITLHNPADIVHLSTPFVAVTNPGLIIVTSITPDTITYLTQGVEETMPLATFISTWSGTAFLLSPQPDAAEPDYAAHRRDLLFTRAKRILLPITLSILLIYLFVANGIWCQPSTILLTLFNLLGFGFTWLLMQKSLKIHSAAADNVCKVIQEGGCDTILETKAATFFGIFSWSEVGFTYFSVSLLSLLIFPASLPALALCNLLCLPFSFWSVWYQRFRAHTWCTLCLCVQATLWLLFFAYLLGGHLAPVFHPSAATIPTLYPSIPLLPLTYLLVLLLLNRLSQHLHPTSP